MNQRCSIIQRLPSHLYFMKIRYVTLHISPRLPLVLSTWRKNLDLIPTEAWTLINPYADSDPGQR